MVNTLDPANPVSHDGYDEGAFNLFDIKYSIDDTKITAQLADGTPLNANDYTYANGVVSVDMNNGSISQNVIVKVPVSITHDFQGNHSHDVEVVFTFKKK